MLVLERTAGRFRWQWDCRERVGHNLHASLAQNVDLGRMLQGRIIVAIALGKLSMDNMALSSSQARLNRTQARERGLTRTWLDSVAPWRLGKSVYN